MVWKTNRNDRRVVYDEGGYMVCPDCRGMVKSSGHDCEPANPRPSGETPVPPPAGGDTARRRSAAEVCGCPAKPGEPCPFSDTECANRIMANLTDAERAELDARLKAQREATPPAPPVPVGEAAARLMALFGATDATFTAFVDRLEAEITGEDAPPVSPAPADGGKWVRVSDAMVEYLRDNQAPVIVGVADGRLPNEIELTCTRVLPAPDVREQCNWPACGCPEAQAWPFCGRTVQPAPDVREGLDVQPLWRVLSLLDLAMMAGPAIPEVDVARKDLRAFVDAAALRQPVSPAPESREALLAAVVDALNDTLYMDTDIGNRLSARDELALGPAFRARLNAALASPAARREHHPECVQARHGFGACYCPDTRAARREEARGITADEATDSLAVKDSDAAMRWPGGER
jgi:hypothetical protein